MSNLIPPKKYRQAAGCHWVQRIDFDGRPCGLEIYQWQPGIGKWCRPNDYARGNDIDLSEYEWVASCPNPLFPEDVKRVKDILQNANTNGDTVTLSASDFEVIHQIIYTQF